jgi:alditol oxidase
VTGLRNWAGNIEFGAKTLDVPESVLELQELVAANDKVRVLGSGHSFNRIADSPGRLVSVADLPKVLQIDEEAATITISPGLRYGEVTAAAQAQGYALHNLGSLPHISVAGACATGTHGSGDTNKPLAAAVSGLVFVRADGELGVLNRDDPDFAGAVISLGALGVMVRMTLDLEPAYELSQMVYDGLPVERLSTDLDEVFGTAYSVSAFTDWVDPGVMVWRKSKDTSFEPEWLGARIADGPRHPIKGMPADFATEQGGIRGPWNERLPHFRLEFTPSNGEELQSEYFVPRERAAEAFTELRALGNQMAGLLQVSEIRTIAADELWLSPSQGRDTVALHFTWIRDEQAVRPVLEQIEEKLLPLGARPHWGKVFTADAGVLRDCYPKVPDFTALTTKYDPAGKFRNAYLETYLPR